MSLRKQAIILGITTSYLSMLVNGKRKWPDALRYRYEELVNTSVNTQAQTVNNRGGGGGLTAKPSVAGAQGGSRTHTPFAGSGFCVAQERIPLRVMSD